MRKRCHLDSGFSVQHGWRIFLSFVLIAICCCQQQISVSCFYAATTSSTARHQRLVTGGSGCGGRRVKHTGSSSPQWTTTRIYNKKTDNNELLLVDEEEEKAGIPIDTLFGRALDTVEDAIRLASRIPIENGWIDPPPITVMNECPTLVVLGSGWAAHALLKIVDTTKTRLILISPSNHFVFTPSTYLRVCVCLLVCVFGITASLRRRAFYRTRMVSSTLFLILLGPSIQCWRRRRLVPSN